MRYKIKKYQIALILSVMHPGIVSVMVLSGAEPGLQGLIGDIVFASIYLPLLVPENFGPVIMQDTPEMFSPPKMPGWLIIIATWFSLYLLIVLIFAKLKHLLMK